MIAKFIRWELLGYKKGQRLRPEDVKAHELHMGFSAEEKHRCKENPNRLFVNKFPLVEMGLIRADNYKYIRWTARRWKSTAAVPIPGIPMCAAASMPAPSALGVSWAIAAS